MFPVLPWSRMCPVSPGTPALVQVERHLTSAHKFLRYL